MKHKMKRFTGLLLAVMMVITTLSAGAVSLDLEKTGAEKADLIPLGTETATVNGKEVNVGDKVTVTYYVCSDAKWEDFQGYVTYDSTGLQLESFTLPNTTSNVMTN
ncbi:MAG: hypothetical protein ACI4RL_04055, partial [Ruminococcus sp.]